MSCDIHLVKSHFNLPWEGLEELLVFINTLTLTYHITQRTCPVEYHSLVVH